MRNSFYVSGLQYEEHFALHKSFVLLIHYSFCASSTQSPLAFLHIVGSLLQNALRSFYKQLLVNCLILTHGSYQASQTLIHILSYFADEVNFQHSVTVHDRVGGS
jgi:hypothetical protein